MSDDAAQPGDEASRLPPGSTHRRATALLIPCPQWDDDGHREPPLSYRVWWILYFVTRKIRHQFWLHDYEPWGKTSRCTWCGLAKLPPLRWWERLLAWSPFVVAVVGLAIAGYGLLNGWS